MYVRTLPTHHSLKRKRNSKELKKDLKRDLKEKLTENLASHCEDPCVSWRGSERQQRIKNGVKGKTVGDEEEHRPRM